MSIEQMLGSNYSRSRVGKEMHMEGDYGLDACHDLDFPPLDDPAAYLDDMSKNGTGPKINLAHGTTTLGFKYQGGTILAVDSRATSGQYIGSGEVKKIIEVSDYLLATMAGGAADCTYWDRVLAMECRLYELRNHRRISVAAASKLLANMAYNYKGTGLSMGAMIAGYDKRGPGLYYVDSEGSRTPGNLFSVGSGSVYAYGVLDADYREELTDEEAYELARRAIAHATYRDSASGGIVRVMHVTKEGKKIISEQDCMELHYKYLPHLVKKNM
ncbi:proteasome subunit beta type-5-like [Lepeophtheirus salmonis]|uniref:proteasome subunit beta type-5-like n=1 Tax=Lepeophtheirus salmonis TaxID=72036 RepID=UPI001AE5B58D|nr:proteasome subunit beta type-5-like [Lepeophtheirus salmonis]